jgi:hypothetical protein
MHLKWMASYGEVTPDPTTPTRVAACSLSKSEGDKGAHRWQSDGHQAGRYGPTWKLPHTQAGSRCKRYRARANHHLTHVAESMVLDTGTSPRDGNGSDE